jgi:hypothetical protein
MTLLSKFALLLWWANARHGKASKRMTATRWYSFLIDFTFGPLNRVVYAGSGSAGLVTNIRTSLGTLAIPISN